MLDRFPRIVEDWLVFRVPLNCSRKMVFPFAPCGEPVIHTQANIEGHSPWTDIPRPASAISAWRKKWH
jgi:hypothetical protein